MSGLAPSILVWVLAVLIIERPLPQALVCYLLLVHIDLSGPEFASASSVGVANGIKLTLLPLVLYVRSMHLKPKLPDRRPYMLWLAFVGYVAVASAWSPYPVSAMKFIVYLGTYCVVFIVFFRCICAELLTAGVVLAASVGALALGVFQTWFTDNVFGTLEGRFTSFTAPQSYAAGMVGLATLLLFRDSLPGPPLSARQRWVGVVAALAGVVLSGSRYCAVGALVAVLYWIYQRRAWTRSNTRRWRALVVVGVLAVAGFVALETIDLPPDSRLAELQEVITSNETLSDIGTFAFRLQMYGEIIDGIQHGTLKETIAGHGTSSGGDIAVSNFDAYTTADVDANRVLHNEYLRALYEWGLIGATLLVGFVVLTLRSLLARPRTAAARAGLALAPTLLVGLGIENVLAAGGTPAGTSFALVLAAASAGTLKARQTREVDID